MALAYNEKTGEYRYWSGNEWLPAQIAENPTGDRVAWDGTEWKPLQAQGPLDLGVVGERQWGPPSPFAPDEEHESSLAAMSDNALFDLRSTADGSDSELGQYYRSRLDQPIPEETEQKWAERTGRIIPDVIQPEWETYKGEYTQIGKAFVKSGIEDNPRLFGETIIGHGHLLGSEKWKTFGRRIQTAVDSGEDWRPNVASIEDVGSFDELTDYLGYQLGHGLGSIGVPILGGVLGYLGGMGLVLGGSKRRPTRKQIKRGGRFGAYVGIGTASYFQNYGDTMEYLQETEGMSEAQAAKYSVIPGLLMASLDSLGVPVLLRLNKEAYNSFRKNLIGKFAKRLAQGGSIEGGVEWAQQIIQETVAEGIDSGWWGDKPPSMQDVTSFLQRFTHTIDALIGGMLTGSVVSSAPASIDIIATPSEEKFAAESAMELHRAGMPLENIGAELKKRDVSNEVISSVLEALPRTPEEAQTSSDEAQTERGDPLLLPDYSGDPRPLAAPTTSPLPDSSIVSQDPVTYADTIITNPDINLAVNINPTTGAVAPYTVAERSLTAGGDFTTETGVGEPVYRVETTDGTAVTGPFRDRTSAEVVKSELDARVPEITQQADESEANRRAREAMEATARKDDATTLETARTLDDKAIFFSSGQLEQTEMGEEVLDNVNKSRQDKGGLKVQGSTLVGLGEVLEVGKAPDQEIDRLLDLQVPVERPEGINDEDILKVAESKNVDTTGAGWGNFLYMNGGRRTLEGMRPELRARVMDALQAIPAQGEPNAQLPVPVGAPDFNGAQYNSLIASARSRGGLTLGEVHRAIGVRRAGSKQIVQKILELAVRRGDLTKKKLRREVLDAGGKPVRNQKGRIKRTDQVVWEAKPAFHSALPEGTRRQVAVEEIPIRSTTRPTKKAPKKAWGVVERALDEEGRVVGQRVIDTYDDLMDKKGFVRKSGQQQANEQIRALRKQAEKRPDPIAERTAALRETGVTGIPVVVEGEVLASERATRTTAAKETIEAQAQRLKGARLSAKAKLAWEKEANIFAKELAKRFRKIMKGKGINPDQVALKVVRKLRANAEGKLTTIDGIRTILIAMDLAQAEGKLNPIALAKRLAGHLNHEVIHLLSEFGVFSKSDIAILEKFVTNKKRDPLFLGRLGNEETYLQEAARLYPDLSHEGQVEEAIAEAYRDYNHSSRRVVGGKPASLFRRIYDFFTSIADVLSSQDLLKVDAVFESIAEPTEPAIAPPAPNMNNKRRAKLRVQRELSKAAAGQAQPDVSPDMLSVRRPRNGYDDLRGHGMTINLEQLDDMAVLTIESAGQRVEVRGQPGVGSVYTGEELDVVIDSIPRQANISSLFAGETVNLPPGLTDPVLNALEEAEYVGNKPIDEMLSIRRPRGTRADLEIANATSETNRQDEAAPVRSYAKGAVAVHRGRSDGLGYSRGVSASEFDQDQRIDQSLRVAFNNLIGQFLYLPETAFTELYIEGGNSTPAFIEMQSGVNSAKIFREAIQRAIKSQGMAGKAVYMYPLESTEEEAGYAQMRLFLSEDRKVGFALKGDDIVSVFRNKTYRGASPAGALIQLAVQEGGRRLDAFDTILPWLYSRNGFRAVARLPWNDTYKPQGWNYNFYREFNDGRPDVVYMVYDPDRFDVYRSGEGVTVSDPDEAVAIQKEVATTGTLVGINELAQRIPGFKGIVAYLTLSEQDRILTGSVNQAVNSLVNISESLPDAGNMASAAYAGRIARGWYENSARVLVHIFGLKDAYRFAAVLASTSPQNSVMANLRISLRLWNEWKKANRSTVGMTPEESKPLVARLYQAADVGDLMEAHNTNLVRALTAKDGEYIDLSGPKVNSFLMNLFGVVSEITNDTHMANYALVSQDLFQGQYRKADKDSFGKLGRKGYGYIANNAVSRRAAKILTKRTGMKWTPEQVQETVWTLTRSLLEIRKKANEDRTVPQILRERGKGDLQREMESSESFLSLFTQDMYRSLLVEGGYAGRLQGITELEAGRRRNSAAAYGRGGVFSAEGAGVAASTFERDLVSTATRLEEVYQRRRDTDTEFESRRRNRNFQEPIEPDANTPVAYRGNPLFKNTLVWSHPGGRLKETVVALVKGHDEMSPLGKPVGWGRRHADRHLGQIKNLGGYDSVAELVEDVLNAVREATPTDFQNMTLEELDDHYSLRGIEVERGGSNVAYSYNRPDIPFHVTAVFADMKLGDLDTFQPATTEDRLRAAATPVMNLITVFIGPRRGLSPLASEDAYAPDMNPAVSLMARRSFANSPVGGVNTDRPILTLNRNLDEKLSIRRSRNNTPTGEVLFDEVFVAKHLNDESFGSRLLRTFNDKFGLGLKPEFWRLQFIDTATAFRTTNQILRAIDTVIREEGQKFEVDGEIPLTQIPGTLQEEVPSTIVAAVTSKVMEKVNKLAKKGMVGRQIKIPHIKDYVTIEDKMRTRVAFILSGQLQGYDEITADFDAWAAARMAERASVMFAHLVTKSPIMYSRGHFHGTFMNPEEDVMPEMVDTYVEERDRLRRDFYANPVVLKKLGIEESERPFMSLVEVLQKVIENNDWKDFFFHGYAVRASRLSAEGRERILTPEKIAAGIQIGEQKPHIKEAWQNFQLLNASLVDMAVKAQVFTEEMGDQFLDTMDYISYYRIFQKGEKVVFKPEIAEDSGLGVLLDVDNSDAVKIHNNMFSNIANVKPLDKELKGGKQTFFVAIGSQIDPVSYRKEYLDINDPDLQGRIAELKELNDGMEQRIKIKSGTQRVGDPLENMFRNMGSLIQASMSNVASQRGIRDLGYLNLAAPLGESITPDQSKSMDVVAIRVKGVEKWFSVADPIAFSWFSRGFHQMPGLELIAMPANLLRELVTKTLGFFISNMARDTQSMWLSSGSRMWPVIGSIIGLTEDISNATLREAGVKRPKIGRAANQLWATTAAGAYDYKGEAKTLDSAFFRSARKSKLNFLRRGSYKSDVGYVMGVLTSPFWQSWRALNRITTASEMAGRIGVFKSVIKETAEQNNGVPNEAQAAFEAMEVINFSAHGRSAIWKYWTTAIPFLNARIQGVDVIYRAGSSLTGGGGLTGWNRAARQRRFLFRSLALISMTGMYSMAQYQSAEDDDDEYLKRNQSPHVRDLNWVLSWRMADIDKDGGINIPTGFEVGLFFKTIPERIARLLMGQMDNAPVMMKDNAESFFESLKRNVKSTLNFALSPSQWQIVRPISELWRNHNTFTGRPVVSYWREQEAPWAADPRRTSYLARQLSKRLHETDNPVEMVLGSGASALLGADSFREIHAERIDHFLQGYFGALGRYAVEIASDSMLEADGIERPERSLGENILVGRFFGNPYQVGGTQDWLYLSRALKTAIRSINDYKELDNPEALRRAELRLDPILNQHTQEYIKRLDDDVRKIQKKIRGVWTNKSMDGEEKKLYIESLADEQRWVLRNVKEIRQQVEADLPKQSLVGALLGG